MSKVPLTLHIGLPKTGTTSIQKSFFQCHPQLFYLGKTYHKGYAKRHCRDVNTYECLRNMLWKLDDDFSEEQASSLFYQEIYPDFKDKVVLGSWEGLVYVPPERFEKMLNRIQAVFEPCRIIIMLRNPLNQLPSLYLENLGGLYLRNRWQSTDYRMLDNVSAWLNDNPSNSLWFNYSENIRISVDRLGKNNVGVFLFEDFAENAKEFYQSLSKFIGIEHDNDWLQHESHYHPRMTEAKLEHIRKMHSSWFWKTYNTCLGYKGRLKALKQIKGSPPVKISLTEELVNEISATTRKNNQWFMETFKLDLDKYKYPL